MADLDEQGRPEPPLAADEMATLVGFLEFQRATLAWKYGARNVDSALGGPRLRRPEPDPAPCSIRAFRTRTVPTNASNALLLQDNGLSPAQRGEGSEEDQRAVALVVRTVGSARLSERPQLTLGLRIDSDHAGRLDERHSAVATTGPAARLDRRLQLPPGHLAADPCRK